MYKVYFDDGYPIVSMVIRASDLHDVFRQLSIIVGEEDAYHKVYEVHQLNTLKKF